MGFLFFTMMIYAKYLILKYSVFKGIKKKHLLFNCPSLQKSFLSG